MTDDELDALLAPDEWDSNRCRVAQALERITDEAQRAKVAAAARSDRVPPGKVDAAIKHLIGVSPKAGPIKRHRAGGCACD